MATSAASLQKMMINAQKQLTKMQITAQKDIQKMSDATSAKTLQFNKEEAKVSRDWQTQMSNTAHQREVADLKKAGLNPVLSASGGGGAASYTTSSASAQAENPSNAIASMMSALMGSIGALTNAQMSATSTQYAADKSAAAQLKAAQASAAATRYAADKQAAASNYAANMAYKTQMEKPASNLWSVLDKYFGSKTAKTFSSIAKDMYGNPSQFFGKQGNENIRSGNYKLTKYGYKTLNKALEASGIDQTYANRRLLVSVMAFGDKKSAKALQKAKTYSSR